MQLLPGEVDDNLSPGSMGPAGAVNGMVGTDMVPMGSPPNSRPGSPITIVNPGSPKASPAAKKRLEEAKLANFFPEASFGSVPSNLLHGGSMSTEGTYFMYLIDHNVEN